MKKTSIASLQERLAGWTDWDLTIYHLGACLGFWPEFGAPGDATGPLDPWHGLDEFIHGEQDTLGIVLHKFIDGLVNAGVLNFRISDIASGTSQFRWNPEYKGEADLISILE